jgi:hypothetical protein
VLLVPGQPLVSLEELDDVDHLAVHPGTHETLTGQVLE